MNKKEIEKLALEYDRNLTSHPMSAVELRKDLTEFALQIVKNLTIHVVIGSLPDKETVSEPIQNALYATNMMTIEVCDNVTDGILAYLDDAGFEIKWKQ